MVTQPPSLITGLLLIEIATSFNIPIAQAGYLQTATSTLAVASGLAMGILALKYNHKTLMITGLTLFLISSAASYTAPTFTLLLLTYPLVGIGGSMVSPMASAYVGLLVPPEKRAKIISYFFAGIAVCVLFGAPYITYLLSIGGWRLPFLLFAFPVAFIAIVFVVFKIPSHQNESKLTRADYLNSFKRLFANRSASACILGAVLTEATWSITSVFGITYLRQVTLIPPGQAWLILVGTSICFLAGSLAGGYFVNKLGRKRLVILTTSLVGVLTISYLNVGVPLISAGLVFAACIFSSMRYTASESLSLEQVPDMRGTMMSMNSIALRLGSAFGSGVGGVILLGYGYGLLGYVGLLSLAASLLIYRYTVDSPSV